jgi:uncharacterized membrane protein YfcA
MTPELAEFARLAPLGLIVGAYGTLIGAGGGSVLVPALLVLLPAESPATITAMSLAVVFFNAYSGTIAYMRMGRVDYRIAVLFTIASIPGAVVGAMLVHHMERGLFDPVFGAVLLLLGTYLVVKPLSRRQSDEPSKTVHSQGDSASLVGSIGSAYIAVLASLLGIGGGIVHVPFLIRVLKQAPHMATATSHFVLTFMALAATITHIALGEIEHLPQTMYLAVGVMMGAPVGAALSTRLHGSIIVRLLAVALCFVGMRLLGRLF